MEKEFENLQRVNLRDSDRKISSAVEAAEPSGEGLTSTSVENPSLNCNMGKTETGKSSGEGDEDHCDGLDSNDEGLEPESECEPVIKCMEKEFDKALDDSAADFDDVNSEYAIHSRLSNVLKHDLRWTDENLKYLKGQNIRW